LQELAVRGVLGPCWNALRPLVELRAFEEAADDLRARAARAAVELGCPLIETQLAWAGYDHDQIDQVRQTVDVFHYQNAKLLLLAAALQRAFDPSSPARSCPNGRALMKLPRGVPEQMPELQLVPETADGVLARCFAQMR